MAFDRNMNQLNDYTFDIARQCVAEGRDEFVFLYKNKEYSLGVCSDEIFHKWTKDSKKMSKSNPPWFCYCVTDACLLVVADKEEIMDKIVIDGHMIKNLWDDIVIY